MAKAANYLPDTNTVLRYLLRDVPEQFDEAERFFESVRSGAKTAIILESVLVECVYILMKFYKVPKVETANILIGLLQYKGIVNQDKSGLVDALRVYADNNLDIVDCVLIAKARIGGQQVFSFDKALKRAL